MTTPAENQPYRGQPDRYPPGADPHLPGGYPGTSGYPPLPDTGAPYPTASGDQLLPSPGWVQYPTQDAAYPAGAYPQPADGQRPYPPAYPQQFAPGYPAGARNGLGTAALVVGILAVVLSWTVYGGVILGILAICFGGVGMGRARRGQATNRGSAMAGLILGIVAIALLVVLVIIGIGLYATGTAYYG